MSNADRNHSAYVYQFGGASLLVDCGEPASRSLRKAGFASETLDALLLSHLHSDHFGGLFMLLQGFWLDQRRKPLPIHLPADGLQPLRRMLEVANLVEELLPFPVRFEPWQSGRPVTHARVRVTPYPTGHLASLRHLLQARHPGQYAAFCFLLEYAGLRAGHSADLGEPADLAPLLVRPLDLLVCELSHFTLQDICAYLAGRPIKKLVFTHLARGYWEDLEGTRAAVRRLLPGMDVSFALDGDVFSF